MTMLDKLNAIRLVGTFFHPNAERMKAMIGAAYAGGLRGFELLNRGEEAPAVFEKLKTWMETACPDAVLGAGTIMTPTDAAAYIALGADFIVAPHTDPEVGHVCQKHGILWIPGFMTPTELHQLIRYGAKIGKLFPGPSVGADHLKVMRPIWPTFPILVSGGVVATPQGIRHWQSAGADVLCFNLHKVLPESWASGDFSGMESYFASLFSELRAA